jgi:hypothetical protein
LPSVTAIKFIAGQDSANALPGEAVCDDSGDERYPVRERKYAEEIVDHV